jgi:hypothetical protein
MAIKKVACIDDNVSPLVHAMFSLYCKEKKFTTT